MGHKYVKEEDTFSTSANGTVPKPTAQEVSDGKVLSASGSWVANSGGGGGSSTLAGLTDVSLSNPSNGQVLKYNGTSAKWENSNESGGSGHAYSTTEQVVGTWIDGKPVYERTFTGLGVTISANLQWYHSGVVIADIDTALSGFIIDGSKQSYPASFGLYSNNEIAVCAYGITPFSMSTLVIQYTKTTD